MRVRSRSSLAGHGKSWFKRTQHTAVPPSDFVSGSGENSPPNVSHAKTETISDEINLKSTKQDRARLNLRLKIAEKLSDPVIRRSVKSDLYTHLLQVHKCSHTKREILDPNGSISFRTVRTSNISYTYNYSVCNALCRYAGNLSTSSTSALLNQLGTMGRNYTSDAYHEPDWFALLTSWHEACDSIMPNKSLLGESMVENGIFIDAFKAVTNPTRFLVNFLTDLKREFKGRKATRLGTVAKAARRASGGFLGYQFAVKPAIDEVVNILSAHQKVQRRLNFLRSNVGGYVPVRARMKIPSDFTNTLVSSTRILCDAKETIGCISSLAKVREDLDYVQDWQAYVQYFGLHKFIGLAWELLPFSFVVDWVTNAGDYVTRYCTPKFGSPFYNIRNICYSRKEYLKESLWIPDGLLHSETASTLVGGPIKVGSFTTTTYVRNPGLPKTSGSIDFSRLGLFHGLASGAMLIQRSPWGR